MENKKRILNFTDSVLNSLLSHVVVIDSKGKIVFFNSAWESFARENNYQDQNAGLGVDYVALCRNAKGAWSEDAAIAADGIESVLKGEVPSFYMEYPCHSPEKQRWFLMRAVQLAFDDEPWVIISHDNITERKLAELERDKIICQLQDARKKIEALSELIPMCAWCKKVRSDEGFWRTIEKYLSDHHQSEVTHTICPDCVKKCEQG